MSSVVASDILVSVIVPVYNTAPTLLETLDSIAYQTLDKGLYEIIIVNDCSTDPETISLLKELEKKDYYKEVQFRIIHHSQNKWLAETRNTGFKHAQGKYVCSLDSDDLIQNDYLKKCILALEAHPNAGIAYTSIRCFGGLYDFILPTEFNARKLFWENFLISAGVFRKQCWLEAGPQKTKVVAGTMKWFEDWDFWIRVVAKGWYAIPVKDTIFFYRQHVASMCTRTLVLRMLSKYMVQRSNFWNYFRLRKTQKKYIRDIEHAHYRRRFAFSPIKIFDRLAAKSVNKVLGVNLKYFPSKLIFLAVLSPRKFIHSVLNKQVLVTLAEMSVGFRDKPKEKDIISVNFPVRKYPVPTIFFCHNSWDIGGAERVLLDWIEAANKLSRFKLLDIVTIGGDSGQTMQAEFAHLIHEQYILKDIGTSPLVQLRICWELICHERPKLVFIMHNTLFYILVPLIKKYFPDTVIVDLLHNEARGHGAYFELSMDYLSAIDKRFVISDHWKNVLIRKYGENPDKIAVAMNAVDLDKFNPQIFDKEQLRNKFNLAPKKYVIGFLGRLDSQKNPDVFLNLAELFVDDDRFEFVMVGGGALEKVVRAATKRLKNLHYLGSTKSPEQYYPLFDVLVCPSVFEGYPLVGMEAAAMNLPVIASNIPGFKEQIALGNFGILYEPVSTEKDAVSIKTIILQNLGKWQEIGSRGRVFVEQHHDRTKQLNIYQSLLRACVEDEK